MNVVLVIPAALVDKADALGEAMGWGPNNYSIPLSANGSEPATHWSLNLANPDDSFLAMLAAAGQGQMPDGLDFPSEDLAEVIGGLVVIADQAHHDAVVSMGLQVMSVE